LKKKKKKKKKKERAFGLILMTRSVLHAIHQNVQHFAVLAQDYVGLWGVMNREKCVA